MCRWGASPDVVRARDKQQRLLSAGKWAAPGMDRAKDRCRQGLQAR